MSERYPITSVNTTEFVSVRLVRRDGSGLEFETHNLKAWFENLQSAVLNPTLGIEALCTGIIKDLKREEMPEMKPPQEFARRGREDVL